MGGANYCILVADDDTEVVESVSSYLEQFAQKFKDRIQVFPALSATDVLTILSEHRIDALFLDYHFEGGMSGDEIIDKIDDPFGDKLVILMSARERREIEGIVIKRHKHLGTRFKFLRKPFDYLEIQDKYLEIEQFFSSRPYPFPLAYARDALLASSTAQGQITAMKDLIESIAKYSVAILMADLDRLKMTDEVNISINWNLGLTLGAWLVWLDNLLNYLGPKEGMAFMPELLQLFGSGKKVSVQALSPLSTERHEKGFAETSVGGSQAKAPAQIFLSYARPDEEKVKNLYRKLSDAGFKPWMDTKDILPGEIWQSCIQKAIRCSDFFLACLSSDSVSKRGFLQKEIKGALDIWQEKLDSDIYLIPVRLEDCEVPESLRKFQWVNLFEEDGWTRLVRAIQEGLERRAEVTQPVVQESIPEEGIERLQKKKGIGYLELMFKFKDEVRDSELGHGYAKEERWYATLVNEYDALLQSLFDDLIFTSRYTLLVPETIDFIGDDSGEYEYKVRPLMGAETKARLVRLRSRSRLSRGEVYLHSPKGQVLSLHPLLTYAICEKCSLARLYLLDNISRTQIVYNAFCNHRRTDKKNKSVFDLKFGALQKG